MKRRWESGLRTGYGWWLFLQLHIDEVSNGVHQVVKLLAELGAGAHGARTGALSRPDAVAALKKYLQVQVAMTAWKARAQLFL